MLGVTLFHVLNESTCFFIHLLVLLGVSLFGEESTQIWSTLIEFKSSEPKPQNNSEKNTITTFSLPISFLETCIGAIKSS